MGADTMTIGYTESQRQRLAEMGCRSANDVFDTVEEREASFSDSISRLNSDSIAQLKRIQATSIRNDLADLEDRLARMLTGLGFLEFKTPTIIPVSALDKMSITEDHPLRRQIFYVDGKRCLRPMLATNLYVSMRNLRNCLDGPIRFFEIGSCFRRESHSTRHLEEFTMLNLVEMSPAAEPTDALKEHIRSVMETVGLDYRLSREESDVYIETIDVEVNGMEVASGAVGPHVLDAAHDIHEPWCGAGFGLERLIMAENGDRNIRRAGRSLAYLDGVRIDM